MADATLQILGLGTSAVPLDYTVSGPQTLDLIAVKGDFDGFCSELRQKGVTFSMEPTDFNPTTRIAFINAPDGVSVELLNRKEEV